MITKLILELKKLDWKGWAMISLITFIAANVLPIIGGLCTVLSGLIAIALVIPGEQPDKALQAALDFLLKFSKK